MLKRGSRFDPLPTSEESDPALLSHRSIGGSRENQGGAAWPKTVAESERLSSHDGFDSNVLQNSRGEESQRLTSVDQPIIMPANGDTGETDHHNTGDELHQDDDDDEALICGLGPCFSPAWLQPLASKQMFLAVFCLACVLQGMFYTYFVSVLTTIEKLFQIQSKTTGIIMSATEMGQIGGALLLTYYGGQGHRPKWIGWGMVLFGASAGLCSLPHFLFWRTKPNTAFPASMSSVSITEMQDSLNLMEGVGSVMPGPQQQKMDLICRQLENATLSLNSTISELERNLQCSSKFFYPRLSLTFV